MLLLFSTKLLTSLHLFIKQYLEIITLRYTPGGKTPNSVSQKRQQITHKKKSTQVERGNSERHHAKATPRVCSKGRKMRRARAAAEEGEAGDMRGRRGRSKMCKIHQQTECRFEKRAKESGHL